MLLQYLAEFFFHMARLVYFTDENNEKLYVGESGGGRGC